MQTPISSPTNSREIPSGSESWYSDCLSLRLTLDAVLLHVLYPSRRRATLRGRVAYRLLVVCAPRSCPKSNFTAPRRVSSIVAGTGGGTLLPSQPAIKCAKEPMCLRTGVPLRCLSVLQAEDPTSAAAQRHWVSATGQRHFQETARRCLRLRADLSRPRKTRESPKAWT